MRAMQRRGMSIVGTIGPTFSLSISREWDGGVDIASLGTIRPMTATETFSFDSVGVGFSYSDHNITVMSTEAAAPVIQQFVTLFFEAFPSFKGRAFHMTGESYGASPALLLSLSSLVLSDKSTSSIQGKYIPLFSAAILDGNIVAKSKGLTPINLQSVAIGNGLINALQMWPTQYDMVCTNATLPPIMSIAECIEMKRGVSSTFLLPYWNSNTAHHTNQVAV